MANSSTASDIKSTAVVKYSSVKWPLQFSTIGLNTDLNHPPADQRGFTVYCDRTIPTVSNFSQFLSVNMAHSHQDLVGQVDVISSSKSIKALLKMPFSSSPHISIMVHRLGETLLLEEFDIVKHIIRKQAEEWNWLRKYYFDVIAKEEKEKQSKFLDGGPANKESIMNNMYMNLIRHSFAASESGDACTTVATSDDSGHLKSFKPSPSEDLKGYHHTTLWKFEDISMLINSDLPIFGGGSSRRPCISLRLRDSRSPPINVLTGLDYWLDNLMSNVPEVAMCYHINGFVQKYEVMKTEDIPNLENSSFDPNEVLDIAQNIMSFIKRNAAIEGHTYWLYKSENDEMVKLYDLTDLCKEKIVSGENPFTVPVGLLCHRVALNLRNSGQRRNADSRAMFENCLRLLDDSKYCEECTDAHYHLSDMWVPDKSVNDIWQEKRRISDLPSDLYDEDATESDDSSKGEKSGCFKDSAKNEIVLRSPERGDSVIEKDVKNSVALKELVVRGMVKKKAWETIQANRIAGTTDERCREALTHIRKGLNCIDKDLVRDKNAADHQKQQVPNPAQAIPLPYSPLNINTKDKRHNDKSEDSSCSEDQELQMCSPWKAIPLPYKQKNDRGTLKNPKETDIPANFEKKGNLKEEESPSASDSTSSENQSKASSSEEGQDKTWHCQAKFRLLRKASITYFVLAKEFFEIKKYGHTLRHLRYALHCFEALEHLDVGLLNESRDNELYMMLLYLAAQTRSCLFSNFSAAHHDFEELGEEEAAILHSAQAVLATPKMSWVYEWSPNLQANLKTALDIFDKITLLPAIANKNKIFQATLKKDLAACVMNLGNVQMELCKEKVIKNRENLKTVKPFINKAMNSFEKAKTLFDSLGEKNNAAHNYSNMAYMHILAAAAIHYSLPPGVILPADEKDHLLKSIEWSEKSAKHYEGNEVMDHFRVRTYQNISLQYQQMANQYTVKSTSSLTDEDVENMKDFFQRSLKYCFLDTQEPFIKKNRSIAANVNLNLAKVCEMDWRKCNNQMRKKHLKQKSTEHYQKSIELYKQLSWPRSEISTVISWISSLQQEADTGSKAFSVKKKLHRNSLCLVCNLKQALDIIQTDQADKDEESPIYKTNEEALHGLLEVLNKSFSSILKIDSSNQRVKDFFRRSLPLTTERDVNKVCPSLSLLLGDLKSELTSDFLY